MDQQDAGLREWPDKDLVVAYKSGVPEAYDEMYRRYHARVYGVCRRMLGNTEDAREATQETFLKAFQALPRFNGQYKLGAWLARIAANVCVDHIRRRNRGATFTQLNESHESANPDLGPEDLVLRDVPALRTLEGIQPLHARALALRNLEGMSHKEIAVQLGISPTQAKALLHRARLSFKRAWDNASGWALAPLVGLRSILHHSSKDASSVGAQLPMWTQTATPFLADKVAASAMVVVVALSGSGNSSTTTDEPAPRTVVSNNDFAGAERATAIRSSPNSTEAPPEKGTLVAEVSGLLEQVKETAERKTDGNGRSNKDDDGNGGPWDPGSANQASQKLVQQVSDTAEEVQDTLPQR